MVSFVNDVVDAISERLVENIPVAKTVANLIKTVPFIASVAKKCSFLSVFISDLTFHGDI